MKTIQKYVADDGTEFNTAEEAAQHDAKVAAEVSVEAYLATTELKGAQRTMAKNAIVGYLASIAGPVTVSGNVDMAPLPENLLYSAGDAVAAAEADNSGGQEETKQQEPERSRSRSRSKQAD